MTSLIVNVQETVEKKVAFNFTLRVLTVFVCCCMALPVVSQQRRTTHPQRKTATRPQRKTTVSQQTKNTEIASDETCHFMVNTDGSFKTSDDKPYYVINRGKKSAHQIYTELQANVAKIFVNPSKVMSGVQDKIIVINGLSRNFYNMGSIYKYSMLYRIEIQVKDGRLRVNLPSINYFTIETKVGSLADAQYETKNPKECLALSMGETDFMNRINSVINTTVNEIIFGVETSTDDDW